jgi:hypothetical protein
VGVCGREREPETVPSANPLSTVYIIGVVSDTTKKHTKTCVGESERGLKGWEEREI